MYCLWHCSLAITSTARVGLWFYVQEHPKAQPAVVLILKLLRKWGHSLKSHPTDWEKPGIEPVTPCLQGIGLSPTPLQLSVLKGLHCTHNWRYRGSYMSAPLVADIENLT